MQVVTLSYSSGPKKITELLCLCLFFICMFVVTEQSLCSLLARVSREFVIHRKYFKDLHQINTICHQTIKSWYMPSSEWHFIFLPPLLAVCFSWKTNSIFIQIDTHALIVTHLLSSSSSCHTKIGKMDDFCIKMHGFEVRVWAHQVCTNFMSCSCSVCYY